MCSCFITKDSLILLYNQAFPSFLRYFYHMVCGNIFLYEIMLIGHTKARNFSNNEYFNQECMTLYFGQETSRITCVCQCGCVSLALINNGTNAYEFMLFGILLRFDKSSEGVRRGDSLVVSYKSTRSLSWDTVIVIIYNI